MGTGAIDPYYSHIYVVVYREDSGVFTEVLAPVYPQAAFAFIAATDGPLLLADGGGVLVSNGTPAWTNIGVPSASGITLRAAACTTSTDLRLVGSAGGSFGAPVLPYAWHWDGSAWSTEPLPLPAGYTDGSATQILTTPAGTFWAIGSGSYTLSGGYYPTVALVWRLVAGVWTVAGILTP